MARQASSIRARDSTRGWRRLVPCWHTLGLGWHTLAHGLNALGRGLKALGPGLAAGRRWLAAWWRRWHLPATLALVITLMLAATACELHRLQPPAPGEALLRECLAFSFKGNFINYRKIHFWTEYHKQNLNPSARIFLLRAAMHSPSLRPYLMGLDGKTTIAHLRTLSFENPRLYMPSPWFDELAADLADHPPRDLLDAYQCYSFASCLLPRDHPSLAQYVKHSLLGTFRNQLRLEENKFLPWIIENYGTMRTKMERHLTPYANSLVPSKHRLSIMLGQSPDGHHEITIGSFYLYEMPKCITLDEYRDLLKIFDGYLLINNSGKLEHDK